MEVFRLSLLMVHGVVSYQPPFKPLQRKWVRVEVKKHKTLESYRAPYFRHTSKRILRNVQKAATNNLR